MKLLFTLATLTVVIVSPGCSESPTAATPVPPNGPRSGIWSGALTDAANGQGSIRMDLKEALIGTSQGLLNGTWSVTFADATKNTGGDVSGFVTGAAVQLTLRRAVPLACPNPGPVSSVYGSYVALDLSLAGTTISGPYSYQACTTAVSGTLVATKP